MRVSVLLWRRGKKELAAGALGWGPAHAEALVCAVHPAVVQRHLGPSAVQGTGIHPDSVPPQALR